VIYVCENNQYAENTSFRSTCAVADVASRAAGYAMSGVIVDGQDVEAVFNAVSDAVEQARESMAPSLIETKTYRYHDHAGGPDRSDATYRTSAEVARWRERDPIALAARRLLTEEILNDADLETLRTGERSLIEAAWQFAVDSPFPPPEAAFEHLFTHPIPVEASGTGMSTR
jgi:acetoin:2,6-dichlorophenolindophenol oxidoreductase subunit alpha